MNPKVYIKTIYAFFSSLIANLALVIEGGITAKEALGVAAAVLVVTGGVYGFPNDPLPADSINQPGKVLP